ncbi:hypothetical protein [Methylobacillus flagellatus]|uniref:hypothetical protein n=1 Tax=Methylobacillus flagellatus TaxID=405 RepID=UPI000045F46F|nr:hypothetical protein [Methylobacillus flagellatus]
MSDQPQDELALVLRRINALSNVATPTSGQATEDDIPILTEFYEGGGALSAIAVEQLLASYHADDVPASLGDTPEVLPSPSEGKTASQVPGIKFLPADEDVEHPRDVSSEQETEHPPLLLARRELAEAVIADMQPVIAQAIQEALAKEMQALTPRLSAEVERVLADSFRERVLQVLKKD